MAAVSPVCHTLRTWKGMNHISPKQSLLIPLQHNKKELYIMQKQNNIGKNVPATKRIEKSAVGGVKACKPTPPLNLRHRGLFHRIILRWQQWVNPNPLPTPSHILAHMRARPRRF
ncbi:Hypothetical predicted protein [Pelobates cultripes]|uniref:Uncharacterized protein n=1 Tax=Pelobates cultripes TaxID=61616 RepID=A0AAD1T811_PELCU|nr:Hypothetical predicted protein [Pelobates cultripes]